MDALEKRVFMSASPGSAIVTPAVVLDYGSPGDGNLAPKDIKRIYGFNNKTFGSSNTTADGSGQTIAIVDAYNDPDIDTDVSNFDSTFNYPSGFTPTVENQTGGSTLPTNAATGDWAEEESLDVEYAHALAPGANILLVEANSDSQGDLLTAVSTAASTSGVSVVSMSWGAPEGTIGNVYTSAEESAYDSVFASHTGITFIAAAGDYGSPGNFPAYSPYVLAVGGTTVSAAISGKWGTETTWAGTVNGTAVSTGGGTSLYENMPSYQQSYGLGGSTSKREMPDVSLNAGTPVMIEDSYDFPSTPLLGASGSGGELGTSVATPIWGALIAIADQGRAITGSGTGAQPLTGISQTMPDLYAAPGDFHDITTGSNGTYSAGTGYDLVTGLGTPRVTNILPALGATPNVAPVVASVVGLFTTDKTDSQNGNDLWTMDTINDTGGYTYGDLSYGMGGGTWVPVTGAWTGGSIKEMGVFNTSSGQWYEDTSGDGQWTSGVDAAPFYYGNAGDIPVVGDWTGTGTDQVGVYRPSTGYFYLWTGSTTLSYQFMGSSFQSGDVPVAGHWGGSTASEIGIFRNGAWYLDLNGDGSYDSGDGLYYYGNSGDDPIVGDWNAGATSGGNPISEIGVYRPSNGYFYLDYNGNYAYDSSADETFTFNTGTGLSTYDFEPISA